MIKIPKGELLEWGVCKVGEEDSQGRWVAEDNLVVLTEEEYNRMVGSPVEGMTFGQAIEAMKQGKKVTRLGWNGKKMYLWLKEGTKIKSDWCHDPALKAIADNHGGEIEALGTICLKTADDKILTGWLASQTDMLSTDWTIAG